MFKRPNLLVTNKSSSAAPLPRFDHGTATTLSFHVRSTLTSLCRVSYRASILEVLYCGCISGTSTFVIRELALMCWSGHSTSDLADLRVSRHPTFELPSLCDSGHPTLELPCSCTSRTHLETALLVRLGASSLRAALLRLCSSDFHVICTRVLCCLTQAAQPWNCSVCVTRGIPPRGCPVSVSRGINLGTAVFELCTRGIQPGNCSRVRLMASHLESALFD